MKQIARVLKPVSALALVAAMAACVHASPQPDPDSGSSERRSPAYTGTIDALFVGHSAMNEIVDDYVSTLASTYDSGNTMRTTQVTNGDISLVGKMERDELDPVFRSASHGYEVAVLTEQWDYESWYDPAEHGADTGVPVHGCPPSGYSYTDAWVNAPADDWNPIPYYLQQYVDRIACGNPEATSFYYQNWTIDYNEIADGTTRRSDPGFVRPTIAEVDRRIRAGSGDPDLAAADLIEYRGVKWERFVAAIQRPNLVFVPANYALAELMRDIETGTAPGFEALHGTDGLTADGELAWVDWIFYEDGYHLSTVGHYFMSLMIFSAVYNVSPEGLEIGSGNFPASEWFPNGQYALEGISNARYQELLTESGASGVYDLRGYQGLDYIHDDLRIYLQRLAWETFRQFDQSRI